MPQGRSNAAVHGVSGRTAAARGLTACALALALVQAPAASAAPAGSIRLSDERTVTRWAHPAVDSPISRYPRRNSSLVGRLRYVTEDGFDEVYPMLRRWTDSKDRTWVQVRIPARRGPSTGWVEESALEEEQVVTTYLTINRKSLKATLFRSGRRIWSSPIGVGAPETPTPGGRFWIRELLQSANPDGFYGPWAFGTSAYSRLSDWPRGGVVGIHGTNQPELIPGRPSHGCVRVPNHAIAQLARLMPIGTPIRIR